MEMAIDGWVSPFGRSMAGWIDGMMEGWSIEVFSMCLDAFVKFGGEFGRIGENLN